MWIRVWQDGYAVFCWVWAQNKDFRTLSAPAMSDTRLDDRTVITDAAVLNASRAVILSGASLSLGLWLYSRCLAPGVCSNAGLTGLYPGRKRRFQFEAASGIDSGEEYLPGGYLGIRPYSLRSPT